MRVTAVVMGRKNESFVWQREELLCDRVVLLARIAAGKITATRTVDEDRVSGEDAVSCVEAHTIRSVSRGVEYSQLELANCNRLSLFNVDIDVWSWRATVHDDWCAGQIVE